MNAALPSILAHALAPYAPAQSVVHKCLDHDWAAVDLQLDREKSDPAVLQRKLDKLTHQEAQLRMLMREAVL